VNIAAYALWAISAALFIGLVWRVYAIQFAHTGEAAGVARQKQAAEVQIVIDMQPSPHRSAGKFVSFQEKARPDWK
jgi:sensor domain CHASE-containing protein